MRAHEFITELRKNPEQNPKLSVYDQLLPYKNDPNVYIHMTDINKLGIAPLSGYDTPLAIYSYPLREVWEEYSFDEYKSIRQLPFGSDRKYVQVFRWNGKGKVVDVSQYTNQDYLEDVNKIYQILNGAHTNYWNDEKAFEELQRKYKRNTEFQEPFSADEQERWAKLKNMVMPIKYAIDTAQYSGSAASKFFNVCRWVSNKGQDPNVRVVGDTGYDLSKVKRKSEISKEKRKGATDIAWKEPVYHGTNDLTKNWNSLLRKLGYAGFSDKKGTGIIHPSEPVQAFFLSIQYLEPIKTILNKDYETNVTIIINEKVLRENWRMITIRTTATQLLYSSREKDVFEDANDNKFKFSNNFTQERFENFIQEFSWKEFDDFYAEQPSSQSRETAVAIFLGANPPQAKKDDFEDILLSLDEPDIKHTMISILLWDKDKVTHAMNNFKKYGG